MSILQSGFVIGGRYRLEKQLGSGGMGTVWQASDPTLRRMVAIKVMSASGAASPELSARFLQEAQLLAQVTDDHVVQVFDTGTLPDGSPYIVMQQLQGRDLADLLLERQRLPVSEAVDYLLQACMAVGAAHARGIIHRDLKPANLFLDTQGGAVRVKVLDFGIAKAMHEERALTRVGHPMGTPTYMAPEQHRGSAAVGVGTDIWALGAILYELVSGKPAFDGKSFPEISYNIVNAEPVPLTDLGLEPPPALVAVIERCLAKATQDRFANVAELANALAPLGLVDADKRAKLVEKLSQPELPEAAGSGPALAAKASRAHKSADPSAKELERAPANRWRDADALLSAVNATQDITFLAGGGLHGTTTVQGGIVDTKELIRRLGDAFANDRSRQVFEAALAKPDMHPYHAALEVFGNEGMAVRKVIGLAVTEACAPLMRESAAALIHLKDFAAAQRLEDDPDNWLLSDAVKTLAALLATPGNRFASTCLTTNFDPLLEVAVKQRAGAVRRVSIRPDGSPNLGRLGQDGTRRVEIVHLHGDWIREDALHRTVLLSPKRNLDYTVHDYLRKQVLLVLGSSGSDRVLLEALVSSLKAPEGCRELWWTFNESDSERIHQEQGALVDFLLRRVPEQQLRLFKGVNAEAFFQRLRPSIPPQAEPLPLPPNPSKTPGGTVILTSPPEPPKPDPPKPDPPKPIPPILALGLGVPVLLLAIVVKVKTPNDGPTVAMCLLLGTIGGALAIFGVFPDAQLAVRKSLGGDNNIQAGGPIALFVLLLGVFFGFKAFDPGPGTGGSGGVARGGTDPATAGTGSATGGVGAAAGREALLTTGGRAGGADGDRGGGASSQSHSGGDAGGASSTGGQNSGGAVSKLFDVVVNVKIKGRPCTSSPSGAVTVTWPGHAVEQTDACEFKFTRLNPVLKQKMANIHASLGPCCIGDVSSRADKGPFNLSLRRSEACTACTRDMQECTCKDPCAKYSECVAP
ncbi:MAG: protein kinase [Myxococcales bacterium]